jgi:hypothetical protein
MNKRLQLPFIYIIILLFATSIILFNIYTENKSNTEYSTLPIEFTCLGNHTTSISIGNSTYLSDEIIYRIDNEDIYVNTLHTNIYTNNSKIINEEKTRYKDTNYEPFEYYTINNVNVTQFKYYTIENGNQIPKYYLILSTKDNTVTRIGSSTNLQNIIKIAKYTINNK